MTTFRIVCLLVLLATPVAAQDVPEIPDSRAALLRQVRAEKAKQLQPPKQNGLEKVVLKIENDYLPRFFTPRTGFYPRIGSVATGGGFALGPGFRLLDMFNGHADWYTSGAYSFKDYWIIESRMIFPRLANGRMFADLYGYYASWPQEDFFGIGPDAALAGRVSYKLEQFVGGGSAGFHLTPVFNIRGGAEYLAPDIGRGEDPRFPDLPELFPPGTLDGLIEQPGFLRAWGGLDVNYSVPAGNPRRGGRYLVRAQRYTDLDDGDQTFNRLDVDLQQYLSAFHDRRVLALRAFGSFSEPDEGARVPFYYMRTLGGSTTLRGFREFRFRDRHMLLLQAEYRFEVFTALDAAVFYDAGMVSRRVDDFALNRLEDSYGFGLRLGTNAGVFMRFDVGFGDEGPKYWFRFGNVF